MAASNISNSFYTEKKKIPTIMSSWAVTIVYVGGMFMVMSTFSYIWRRRKAGNFFILEFFFIVSVLLTNL